MLINPTLTSGSVSRSHSQALAGLTPLFLCRVTGGFSSTGGRLPLLPTPKPSTKTRYPGKHVLGTLPHTDAQGHPLHVSSNPVLRV